MILSESRGTVSSKAAMASITYNIEELKLMNTLPRDVAYYTLWWKTIEEYVENMRVRFDYEEPSEDYIEECRYYEVNMLDNTESEAIEAITNNGNLSAVTIVKMNKAIIDYHEEEGIDLDVECLTDIAKLYTMWRYVVTSEVVWTINDD